MASEKSHIKIFEELGFKPKEDRTIIVQYQANDMSEAIYNFFSTESFILQLTYSEILIAKLSDWTTNIKKESILSIPYAEIENIDIYEHGLNYRIDIKTSDSIIKLSAQQGKLSGIRLNSLYVGLKNWHEKNVNDTLDELKNIKKDDYI
ncbi:hypothetical protein [Peptostreptococcus faecalis]|uniref:hypothetical protein n=1 Tax=Peptostreptococcus faecalis TaxID=2045015 RepID=UPI000C7D4A67|nr:hypothetical protein [Peptostreptococcus faecalis]